MRSFAVILTAALAAIVSAAPTDKNVLSRRDDYYCKALAAACSSTGAGQDDCCSGFVCLLDEGCETGICVPKTSPPPVVQNSTSPKFLKSRGAVMADVKLDVSKRYYNYTLTRKSVSGRQYNTTAPTPESYPTCYAPGVSCENSRECCGDTVCFSLSGYNKVCTELSDVGYYPNDNLPKREDSHPKLNLRDLWNRYGRR
ncbi:hypothetical protein RUND412_006274 [Rhizina undulata]